MAQTVIGFFDNRTEAQQAVEALESKGFSSSNIDISNRSATDTSTSTTSHRDSDEHESGIERFFKNLFGDSDHDDRDKYSRVARESDCIVTVHAQSADEAERAADILDDNGAVNVDERASQYGYTGSSDTNRDTAYSSDTNKDTSYSSDTNYSDTNKNTGETIDVIKEDLEVGKREVETGGVRLRSRIVERPVEESVRLREERVNVTRNPVDREATDADLNAFEERDIEMVEKSEVPVINKQARVVEEVSLNKEVEERTETVSENLRHTEVDVENLNKEKTTRTTKKTDY